MTRNLATWIILAAMVLAALVWGALVIDEPEPVMLIDAQATPCPAQPAPNNMLAGPRDPRRIA